MKNTIRDGYESQKQLREIILALRGRKFCLDCGHHVTFGHNLGNNIVVYNGREPKAICSLCAY